MMQLRCMTCHGLKSTFSVLGKMSILLVLDVTVQDIFNWLRNGAEIQELLQGRVKNDI